MYFRAIQAMAPVRDEHVGGHRTDIPPLSALGKVLSDHLAGGWVQGYEAVLAKLGTANGQHRGVQVNVCKLEVERLAQSQACDAQQSEQAVLQPWLECVAPV